MSLMLGRCDGTRPTCENCARRSEPCTYDEAVRRRGPGKRTKEMRERAAREAEAEGMTNENSAGAGPGPGPTTLAELEMKKGKKRKSDGVDDGDKKPKFEEDEDGGPPVFE